MLEQSVPDGHRWGVKWLTPAEYDALQKRRADYMKDYNRAIRNSMYGVNGR